MDLLLPGRHDLGNDYFESENAVEAGFTGNMTLKVILYVTDALTNQIYRWSQGYYSEVYRCDYNEISP